jgi:redox-sensitive bicupin YhaK (pirin superfamily)
VLIGEEWGVGSPVATLTPTLYLDMQAQSGGMLTLPASDLERGVYPDDRQIDIDGMAVEPFQRAILAPGASARIGFLEGGRVVVLGGAPMDGRRHIWWNFVSSSRERIESAKRAWQAQTMGRILGETEFIPLPQT